MTRLDANVVGTSLGYVEHNQTESRKSTRPLNMPMPTLTLYSLSEECSLADATGRRSAFTIYFALQFLALLFKRNIGLEQYKDQIKI